MKAGAKAGLQPFFGISKIDSGCLKNYWLSIMKQKKYKTIWNDKAKFHIPPTNIGQS